MTLDIRALEMVDEAYSDRTEWIKKSIRTSAKVRSLFIHVSHPALIKFDN
jgi:hypothetical protein